LNSPKWALSSSVAIHLSDCDWYFPVFNFSIHNPLNQAPDLCASVGEAGILAQVDQRAINSISGILVLPSASYYVP